MKKSRTHGFTLIEVLVAVAIFAAMAALAWGGLDAIVRSREKLGAAQEDFSRTQRSLSTLERDLRSAAARPVRGNYGEALPALRGDDTHLEFTRLGFAHPLSEQRSNLERVTYELDGKKLQRGRFVVLDRAADSAPVISPLRDGVKTFRLRYLNIKGQWLETWPARDETQIDALPRAVEFRLDIEGLGEVRRVVELPAQVPTGAPQ
jgi:general secretion pathway protein J